MRTSIEPLAVQNVTGKLESIRLTSSSFTGPPVMGTVAMFSALRENAQQSRTLQARFGLTVQRSGGMASLVSNVGSAEQRQAAHPRDVTTVGTRRYTVYLTCPSIPYRCGAMGPMGRRKGSSNVVLGPEQLATLREAFDAVWDEVASDYNVSAASTEVGRLRLAS